MSEGIRKIYIRTPERAKSFILGKLLQLAIGCVLSPMYFLFAVIRRGPGLGFHLFCMRIGSRLLISRSAPYSIKKALAMILAPMDSTRYFEFDYVARTVRRLNASKCLDVSSPRMIPVFIAHSVKDAVIDLINPDIDDLSETREVIQALNLESRMPTVACLITEAPFPVGSFDLVTCVSVLEHIPDDTAAVEKMWSLLKPGGVLVLTLPCLSVAAEQYIDLDTYKLLAADADGFVFWQRFYDQELLERRVLSVLGSPADVEIFGEKVAGSFYENAQKKRRARWYPFWREPYMMASEYGHYEQIGSLPGDGVIAMTFVKA